MGNGMVMEEQFIPDSFIYEEVLAILIKVSLKLMLIVLLVYDGFTKVLNVIIILLELDAVNILLNSNAYFTIFNS